MSRVSSASNASNAACEAQQAAAAEAKRPLSGFFSRGPAARFTVEVHSSEDSRKLLAWDVRTGLSRTPKSLPPKYFYDELGSRLFDAICDTSEYYQTRTELALLKAIAPGLVERVGPTDLVEFGSGAARKTRVLLDAMMAPAGSCRYVPFDVSEAMLRSSAERLLQDYPALSVHGIVGDYERHLSHVPAGARRLFIFLGSTIGNFEAAEAVRFIERIGASLGPEDHFLIGMDLVKDERILNAAYNDAQGITARFNKNVLAVINRELHADFDLERFSHVAFFDRDASQIEMHLEAKRQHGVWIRDLELAVPFEAEERVRTEISRKFTKESAAAMLEAAGLALLDWFVSPDGYFALALSARR